MMKNALTNTSHKNTSHIILCCATVKYNSDKLFKNLSSTKLNPQENQSTWRKYCWPPKSSVYLNLHDSKTFYLPYDLRSTFNEARVFFILKWSFHFLEARVFEVFRVHKVFLAILFWNRYKDRILNHTEKEHTLDLLLAVPLREKR